MAFHTTNLQAAIYSALSTDANVLGLVAGVFDDVPEETAYPFISFGDETSIDSSTKDSQAQEYTVTMHIFSEFRGKAEVKNIMSAVYDVLHDSDMIVTDANLINLRFEFSDIVTENDGITRHGVMRFRAVVFDQ